MRSQNSRWSVDAFSAFDWASYAGYDTLRSSHPYVPGDSVAAGVFAAVAALPLAIARVFDGALSSIPFPRFDISSQTYRRLVFTVAGVSITGVAIAATAMTKGYIDHPEQFWVERIAERMQSPIYGRDNTLIGSVGEQQARLTPDEAREYAFIPLQGDLPPTYLDGLLKMENQNYFAGGWHNICGLDIPATLKRWVLNPGAGGSSLAMQLAKELKRPEWGSESNLLQKMWRKGLEIGASCRLHNMLVKQGGDAAFLKMYAAYAPTFQGNGTLRGIEAGSRIVFDVAPQDLTNAQQLVFAASARKPLTLLPPGATGIDCNRVYPKKNNPLYEPQTAKANVSWAVQCQVLHRAIYRAPDVLQGERLDTALAELHEYQVKGIHPANPFEPIPAKKLVNLASRTASAMPKGLLAKIQEEADEESIALGTPLYVTLDAVRQHDFHQALTHELDHIQRSSYMRRTLCLPLVFDKERPVNLPVCGPPHDEVKSADVLAVNVDVASGGLKALYASSPLLLASNQSIGSIAKWIVIVAALTEGYRPENLLCPKAARDGDRPLKRAAAPEHGFENCDGGRHLITWERATATSDNLAYYQVAQQLGTARLAAAAAALGLGDPAGSDNLPYEVSFGTYGATPRDLISGFQALVAVAYGIKTTGRAPRALRNASDEENPAIAPLKRLLPTQAQRDALRQLLEAPVQTAGGTLAFLKNQVTAGKTGTVQSAVMANNHRHFNHAKWAMTYQHDKATLNLFLVAAPLPTVPLAQHDLSANALMPAHIQILSQE
jgi:membrane peptidoglycan carboxypeptidase